MCARRRREVSLATATAAAVAERADVARRSLKLDLTGLQLTEVPGFLYADPLLKHLRILWLSNNLLDALPPELVKLAELSQLRAQRNRLRALPPALGRLPRLQILWLQDNRLETLPPEVRAVTLNPRS